MNNLLTVDELIDEIFIDCFNGGEVVSSVFIEDEGEYCAMENGIESPYVGQLGQMKEFNIADDGMGARSSLMHCEIDFSLVAAALATLQHLGIRDANKLAAWNEIQVGMNDFIFKKTHKYTGYSMGRFEPFYLIVATDLWIDYWKNNLIGG